MMKHFRARSAISIVCLLALCLVLTACSGVPGVGAVATPTRAPTPTPTPTVSFTTITGDGYTIESPVDWISKGGSISGSSLLVLARDSQLSATMEIETLPAATSFEPALTATQEQISILQTSSKNFQDQGVPTTVTINGVQWNQAAATMDDSRRGAMVTSYVLATTFPSNANKVVMINYTALSNIFDKADTEYFQPMLLSFKFT